MNNHIILYQSETPGDGIEAYNVALESGCTGDDVCATSPCPINANCFDNWNLHECQCKDGWLGDLCEISSDDCTSHQCGNQVWSLTSCTLYIHM